MDIRSMLARKNSSNDGDLKAKSKPETVEFNISDMQEVDFDADNDNDVGDDDDDNDDGGIALPDVPKKAASSASKDECDFSELDAQVTGVRVLRS
jgi:hypothetical protein